MADSAKTGSEIGLLEGKSDWDRFARLQCEFTIEVPLPSVKLADLLGLKVGSVIDSRWKVGTDVPARVNGVVVAWSEFEVVNGKLAVRVTDLA